MMLVDYIFKLFGYQDAVNDVNKDSEGKGTLERYNLALGKDFDAQLLPKIENLLQNVILPSYNDSSYLSYLEQGVGNAVLFLSDDVPTRRKLQRQITRFYEIKGSVRSYEIMFSLIGFQATITETYAEGGFDSSETFDSSNRTFDTFCSLCSTYSIDLTRLDSTTTAITATEQDAIEAIIAFNEPINAKLSALTFNTENIIVLGEFSFDFSNDFNI